MIRLVSARKQPSFIHTLRGNKTGTWVRSSSCRFSSLAAQLTQQNPSSGQSPNFEFDSHLYGTWLRGCIQRDDSVMATGIHCDILKKGNCLDLFATNILLNVYVQADMMSEASQLFDEMPERNTVSFVTLIQGLMQSLQFLEALDLFSRLHREGHELNPFVFTSILKALVCIERVESARCIHACTHKLGHDTNAFVGTALIDAYTVCGCVNSAREVFEGIVGKDMVTWTGMVASYAENNCFEEALDLFSQMRIVSFHPNNFTFAAILKACIGLGNFHVAKAFHGLALKTSYVQDIYVGIMLLELYVQCGDFGDAKQVFGQMPKKDVIPWSFMISRFSQSSLSVEAVHMFCQMREALVAPNQFTFSSVLQACATMRSLEMGKQIHCLVLKGGFDSSIFVSNAVMDLYAKCERIEDSMKLFEELFVKTEVAWNIMIVGYVNLGHAEKALGFFMRMLENQVEPTEVTYSTVLRATAVMAALEPGIQFHSLTIKTNYDKHTVVANSLIDMYAKCGQIRDARSVFDMIHNRDEVSWNTIISAYAMHGRGIEALKIFQMMLEMGCKPNVLTFVGVLSACSNSGLLEEGKMHFKSMVENYGIEPCVEHYSCMIWLFGRSGHLDEAVKLIEEMPNEPGIMVWRALLCACVIHNNVEIGKFSAENILEMEPHDESTHLLLSNMYASARKWKDVSFVRKKMKEKGMKKEPGLSWVENQGTFHYFSVGDTSHPDLKVINGILEWMNLNTRKAGYVPNLAAILIDVEDNEKERLLWLHSERLALAFALFRTPPGSCVRIMKNLRICVDCHAAMKAVSKILQRVIVMRDMNRFHQFQNGICSCGDYW